MRVRMTGRAGICASMGLVLCAACAWGVAPQVKDDAKFFSDETVRKVNRSVREIAREFDRDVLIETVPNVPGDQTARVKAMSTKEREEFFHNWATDRADAAVVHGVYILVCKDPPHLDVEVTERGRKAFSKEDINKLRENLLKAFREKKFDTGIVEAVDFARSRFAAMKK